MLIDSHCHLDSYPDLPAVLARARQAGVGQVLAIGIGDGPETMHRALELAHAHSRDTPEVWASVGIHPQEAHRSTPEALAKLSTLAGDPRCLAVGEIGLDYYHLDNPQIPVQQSAFIAQIRIAAEAGKPVIIHCRTSDLATPAAKAKFATADAWEDLFRLLHEHWTPTGLPGIMHCFSGNQQQAERSLAAGFYLSFAGNVTYPKATILQSVAAGVPSDRILVETDAPFLAPIPLRGGTNEPAFVTHTVHFVAGLRGVSTAQLAENTTSNFGALFPASKSGSQRV